MACRHTVHMRLSSSEFERVIGELTRPLNGQLPRPWISDLKDPLQAAVFIVGQNQAKTFPEVRLPHERHVDGLFNRNGESARGIYDEMTGGKQSRTRTNIDMSNSLLKAAKVRGVLETNVVCYSTPMSSDLRSALHVGGRDKGTEIFQTLLRFIKPKVLIAHGAGTRAELSKVLSVKLPEVPISPMPPQFTVIGELTICIIPSLAPPKWNSWCRWAPTYLGEVAAAVSRQI